MVNDINGFRSRSLETPDNKSTSRTAGSGGTKGTGTPAAAPSSGHTDTVNLTDAAGRMHELQAQLANAPEVDSARVESLRRAIADGQYNIDSVHVTDKLIQLEQSLFGMSGKK